MLANTAFEDTTLFKHWGIDTFVTSLTCTMTNSFLDIRHVLVVFGQDVVCALRGTVVRL
jgi:hypothetical protein